APIAAKRVDAMSGLITDAPGDLGAAGLPEERSTALQAMGGGLSGLGPMMSRIGGMMVGSQTGAAIGALAREVATSTDVGLPLGPEGTAAPLPAGGARVRGGASGPAGGGRASPALPPAGHPPPVTPLA